MSTHSPQDPEENLPDWLKALRKKQTGGPQENSEDAAPQEPARPDAEPEEEPGWLQEIRKRRQSELASQSNPAPEGEHPLTDTQPNPPTRLEKRRLKRAKEKAATKEEQLAAVAPKTKKKEPDLPDWLNLEAQPDEISEEQMEIPAEDSAEPPAVTPAFKDSDQEQLSPGELPSWLQAIRPGGTNYPDEDTRSAEMLPGGDQENAGPLAGLSGVLQAEPEIAKIGKAPVFSSRLEVTDSQYRHAAALRDLVAGEALPKEDESKRVARPTRVLNAVMAATLMLAVVIPLVSGSQAAARPQLSAFPESADVFNAIEVLPPDAPVLIAFDVEPALYGEMKAPLRAVLAHLLDRQARLAFISTQPTGPALAERILQEEFSSSPTVATKNYTNLGYLAGGMAALRSFSSDPRAAVLSVSATQQDPWQAPALLSIAQLNDFAFVLVVASDAEDGRAWIEQTGTQLSNGMYMVSSAQAAPVMQPYLQSDPPTLRGLVSGLIGGAYYEELRAQDGLGRAYWDSFSYGLGAIFLVILLGGLYGRLIQLRPERPAKGTQS
jgi:hypothetical protein